MIPWWRTSFGDDEIRQLTVAVNHAHISQGPLTAEFEARVAEMLNVPYAVVTTSGSVALLMALMALGVGPDDEVIIPNRTWIATAHAPLILGAKVKLVDVVRELPLMDVSQIRAKITPRTKAIIPVHLNGRAVNMDEVLALGREHGLHVVEDACQALFSRNNGRFLGTGSDAGCFSFGVTKFISTGQGGVVVTRSGNLYEKLKLVRNHGVVDNFTDQWNHIGCNFKFTDLLAAFGLAQLKKVEDRITSVNRIYSRYTKGLKELSFLKIIPVNVSLGEVPLFIEVLCEQRNRLMEYLKEKGVQTRPSLPSLDRSGYFEHEGRYPHSDLFASQGFFLPCGPDQPIENVDTVIRAIQSFQ